MSAVETLITARAAGIEIELDDDNLLLEASSPPPATILKAHSRYKADIISLLRPQNDEWSVEDWIAVFNERSAIAEFDGGLTRPEAEACAFECCIVEWLNRNAVVSSPDQCHKCGGADRVISPLLPFGTDINGHAWLHSLCWKDWLESRNAEATKILNAIGIEKPINDLNPHCPNDLVI